MERLVGLKILQANLNRCWEAQQLLEQAIAEKGIHVAVISEPHHSIGRKEGWIKAKDDLAALWVSDSVMEMGLPVRPAARENGIAALEIGGTIIASVYVSPNAKWEVFEKTLQNLERLNQGRAHAECIIAGDFNAHSPCWGSKRQDRRGGAVLDLCARLGTTMVRSAGEYTFQKNGRESLIDIIMCTKGMLELLGTSRILDEYNGSDHRYLLHIFNRRTKEERKDIAEDGGIGSCTKRKFCPVTYRNLVRSHMAHWAPLDWSDLEQVKTLITVIDICAMASTKRLPNDRPCKRVAWWWSEEVAEQRKQALRSRRKLQRATRRKRNEDEVNRAREAHKMAQKELKRCIRASKKAGWDRFLDTIDADPWGRPYKTVIKAMKGVNVPAVLESRTATRVIEELFTVEPSQDRMRMNPWAGFHKEAGPPLGNSEVRKALARMKEKAPGIDGVSVAAIAEVYAMWPHYVTNMLGACLREGYFPPTWKQARLVLLPKGDTREGTVRKWRPICLLSNWAKLMEHVIKDRLVQGVRHSDRQHGFRSGRSTVSAMDQLMAIWDAARTMGKHCLLVTIDVKNAFNSLTWEGIVNELQGRMLQKDLVAVLRDYLTDRRIVYNARDGTVCRSVHAGVPQGSVLGPTLWNLVYDQLLDTELPDGVHLIGYADDVAVVVTGRELGRVSQKAQVALTSLNAWFRRQSLEVAHEKTQMVLLTGRRVRTPVTIKHGNSNIKNVTHLPYLGLIIEGNRVFRTHVRAAATKAMRIAGALARISPNTRGGGYESRLLHYRTVESVILYAAPIWATEVALQSNGRELRGVQRAALSRVARAYRTVSLEALCVLTGVPPLDITAQERHMLFRKQGGKISEEDRRAAKGTTLSRWQNRWDAAKVGRWTHEVIPNLSRWIRNGPPKTSYRITQALTGHGCFAAYLYKIGRINTPLCWYGCGVADDARHTLFECKQWKRQRDDLQAAHGHINAGTVTELLLDARSGAAAKAFIETAIREKEEDETRWEIGRRSRKKKAHPDRTFLGEAVVFDRRDGGRKQQPGVR